MKSSFHKFLALGAIGSLALLYFWPEPQRYSRDPQTTDGCSAPRSGFVVSRAKICLNLADDPYFDVRINPNDPDSDQGLIYRIHWDDSEVLEERYAFPAATRRVQLVSGQIANNTARQDATASELPNLQRYKLASREYVFTDAEMGFDLYCEPSFSPQMKELGAEDCEVSFQLDPYFSVRVSYGTFQWSGEPGWPVLDANWANELSSTIQAARESVTALIEIQKR